MSDPNEQAGSPVDLYCCLCLYTGEGGAAKAETIISGHAVCYDHMPYMQGDQLSRAIHIIQQEQR